MFALRSPQVRRSFTSDDYGPNRALSGASYYVRSNRRPEFAADSEVQTVDSDMIPQTSPKLRRRLNRLVAVGLVATGALLAACSSSSTSATTTTAPSAGALRSAAM